MNYIQKSELPELALEEVLGLLNREDSLELRRTCRLWNQLLAPKIWYHFEVLSSRNLRNYRDSIFINGAPLINHLVFNNTTSNLITFFLDFCKNVKSLTINSLEINSLEALQVLCKNDAIKGFRRIGVSKLKIGFHDTETLADNASYFNNLTTLAVDLGCLNLQSSKKFVSLLPSNRLKVLLLKLPDLSLETLNVIQTRFPNLKELGLASRILLETQEESNWLVGPFNKLQTLRLTLNFYQEFLSDMLALSPASFPMLTCLDIQQYMNSYSQSHINFLLETPWPQLNRLEIFDLQKNWAERICTNFFNLREFVSTRGLMLGNSDVRTLLSHLRHLTRFEIRPIGISDEAFELPARHYCLRNLSLSAVDLQGPNFATWLTGHLKLLQSLELNITSFGPLADEVFLSVSGSFSFENLLVLKFYKVGISPEIYNLLVKKSPNLLYYSQ